MLAAFCTLRDFLQHEIAVFRGISRVGGFLGRFAEPPKRAIIARTPHFLGGFRRSSVRKSRKVQGIVTRHGFLLSGGSYTTLDPPGSTFTGIYFGINDSGQIVGQYQDVGGTSHGFPRLNDGSYTAPLDPPGSAFTVASGINDSGQIVGWYQGTAGGPNHGFLLSGGIFTTFDVPGSTFTTARGINDSGQIVGAYQDAGGTRHGYLATSIPEATPIPEPSTFLLLGMGALGVYA